MKIGIYIYEEHWIESENLDNPCVIYFCIERLYLIDAFMFSLRFLYCREYFQRLVYNLARYCWKMIMEYCKHAKMWQAGGINVSIICIVTLFLAEYCGFGWVVGTFFWVFCFCFGIAWTTKFKHWGVHSAAKRLRPRRASLFSGATSAASRRSEPPNV